MADGAGRFYTAPPHKGQSTLVSGLPGRRESRRRHPWAPGHPTPAHRLCVPQGGAPKAGPSPGSPGRPPVSSLYVVPQPGDTRFRPSSRGPTHHQTLRSAPPPLQGGPASESDAGRSTLPNPGSRPQSGCDLAGPGPRRGARVCRRPPPGPRPCLSSHGRTSRSPSVLRHGEPPSPARPGPARRQGRGLSPQSRAAPATREPAPGGESAPPRSPPSAAVVPLLSGHEIARFSASRHPFEVGPSGAEQLSVRHARLRGHAPWRKEFIDIFTLLEIQLEGLDLTVCDKKDDDRRERKRDRKERNFENWLDAFRIMACIIVEQFPHSAADLWLYESKIHEAHRQFPGDAWLEYDKSFRLKMQAHPEMEWNQEDVSSYIHKMMVAREVSSWVGRGDQPFRNGNIKGKHEKYKTPYRHKTWHSAKAHSDKGPQAICWKFNTDECSWRQNCKFKHSCSACGGEHPASTCRKNRHKSYRKDKKKKQ
ncbi:hypothetical protein NDU88_009647 [Pleurodeles waltl]|uniref:C3H1-type domain-containing protein n=1 Tax=Pleurodeles waltl TaxID=8319 RepID=A0AAV7PTU5_PLEWA|nr:hypothetical protein NDU88_009647 [Pleurodeles waltl]